MLRPGLFLHDPESFMLRLELFLDRRARADRVVARPPATRGGVEGASSVAGTGSADSVEGASAAQAEETRRAFGKR
jgi:hypothetical protein